MRQAPFVQRPQTILHLNPYSIAEIHNLIRFSIDVTRLTFFRPFVCTAISLAALKLLFPFALRFGEQFSSL